ncbi:hypothetical protein O3I_025875 [Nocardia brasiliensis ATCC 700358]|uniref:Uncharacterized protein n=1 Tax=Nocardia brasiliensis (strain ATCC 700358 / HUJEG-1) TaxID=1133849 RepID=K0F121_NOCB7|nr:hypothetical protein O3I_025875 [Nocardia brasiliensis ATCC 700358]
MRGTRGTSTMPAPSLPRRLERDEDRPVRIERELPRVLGVDAIAAVGGAGAVPHTSQYPSITVPAQPGSVQCSGVAAAVVASAAAASFGCAVERIVVASAGAVPQTVQ